MTGDCKGASVLPGSEEVFSGRSVGRSWLNGNRILDLGIVGS